MVAAGSFFSPLPLPHTRHSRRSGSPFIWLRQQSLCSCRSSATISALCASMAWRWLNAKLSPFRMPSRPSARPAVGLAGHEKGASRRSLCTVRCQGAALRSIWHVVVAGGASGYIGGACAVANPMISVRAASIVTYVMRTCPACLDRWAVLDALRPFAVPAVRATPPVTYVMRARGARCDRWPTVQAPAQPAWSCEIIRPRGLATEPPPILRRNESFQVAALTRPRRNDPPGREGKDHHQCDRNYENG